MTKGKFLVAIKNCIEGMNNAVKAVRIEDIQSEHLFRDQPVRQRVCETLNYNVGLTKRFY
jgi:hypothetical protein